MQVADIMHRDVVTVNGQDTFAEAAKVLRDHAMTWAVEEMTGGFELPDLERSSAALSAAVQVERASR